MQQYHRCWHESHYHCFDWRPDKCTDYVRCFVSCTFNQLCHLINIAEHEWWHCCHIERCKFWHSCSCWKCCGCLSAAAAPSLFYTTDPCVFVAPADGRLQCPTIAGVGNALSWTVTIGGQTNSPAFLSAVAYVSPSLSNVISALLNSDGGDPIVIQGSNFGPATTPNNLIQVVYGPGGNAFTATGCSITTAQTEVTCTSMAGAGLAQDCD